MICTTASNNKISVRANIFYPLTSDQACFKNKYKKMNLDVARELSANIIVLPLYAGMDAGDIERIVDVISKNLKRG